jgi:hypothetical protein
MSVEVIECAVEQPLQPTSGTERKASRENRNRRSRLSGMALARTTPDTNMPIFKVASVLLVVGFVGTQPVTRAVSELNPDEKLIIEIVLTDSRLINHLQIRGTALVRSETERFHQRWSRDDTSENRPAIPQELLDAAKNTLPASLRTVVLPRGLVVEASVSATIEKVITVSRPGVSLDRRRAIVAIASYYYGTREADRGYLVHLENDDGKWHVVRRGPFWIS